MQKNARFWIFWGTSPVKLTLGPGEATSIHRSQETDEGWNFEAVSLHYDAERGVITRSDFTDGTDCDGRLSRTDDAECLIEDLDRHHCLEDGISYPLWQRVRSGQRDYAAEAMGY